MNYDQTASAGLGAALLVPLLISLVIAVFELVAVWKVFTKAGKPGWGAIIPFYNLYLLIKVAGRPGWWLILYIIPLVNIIIHVIVSLDIARAFGKGAGFGVIGLWLFGVIGYPILGFGSAQYLGPQRA